MSYILESEKPEILRKALEFRQRRDGNESKVKLHTFDPAYEDHEETYVDKFIDPYMRKVYPDDRSTEIVSMGLDHFYGDPVAFAERDPEYFDFIYDLVRNP